MNVYSESTYSCLLFEELGSYTVQKLPSDERPREKMLRHGGESLSTIELIAVILGTGTKDKPVLQLAQDILMRFGNLQRLYEATIEELCQIRGVGLAKAMQLKAAFCLGAKFSKQAVSPKLRVDNPMVAYRLLKDELQHETREHFVVMMIDAKGNFISYQVVAVGTLTNILVHPREVFYPAIRHKAASVILAHNHPSGDPMPSPEDFEITKILIQVGQLLDIPVRDHLILTEQSFISMKQRGFLFF